MSIYVDALRYNATTHDTVKHHWLFLQEKSSAATLQPGRGKHPG